ncbi:hypothetical protein [Ammoniphilus sp. CFH 90114]|uniref:hypothetical protein n=1 Tax=Ammoniphilus sp. CFH 90114 TaxID=2493665 RepID=UPI00100EB87C|nr:hypothetical protein [Ammoniphilus sp. CFH 90114]RXT07811.1 hypothetical protein EIZ39_10290 [Ammoniphilus sp. CFH 90114]
MTKNSYPWFIKNWLHYWEKKSLVSRWNKARALSKQKQVTSQEISRGRLVAQVSGSERHLVTIRSQTLEEEKVQAIVGCYLQHPAYVMKLYQGAVTEEEAMAFPFSLGLSTPAFIPTCSCAEPGGLCVHILASVWAAADQCSEDPALYLTLCGIPWEEVLEGHAQSLRGLEGGAKEGFKLVPIPEKKSSSEGRKKELVTPPFWTSPFPYVFIMQEIYAKVMEEARQQSR